MRGRGNGVRRGLIRSRSAKMGATAGVVVIAALLLAGPTGAVGTCTVRGGITEYPVPSAATPSGPNAITSGPDGNVWFIEQSQGKVGRITSTGEITEFPVPTSNPNLVDITTGPDGAMWFSEIGANQIARITLDGQITEYPIPLRAPSFFSFAGGPLGIITGPDGAIWFVEGFDNQIGRFDVVTHTFTEFDLPSTPASSGVDGAVPVEDLALPSFLTTGPDGALWFTESRFGGGDIGNKIGRMTLDGHFDEFTVPTIDASPKDIEVGSDGNLWFTEGYNIGRITPQGAITEFPIRGAFSGPSRIVSGPDGALWFNQTFVSTNRDPGRMIGRITTAGRITEYYTPTPKSTPAGITTGPDNNIWFTESTANQIGVLRLADCRP